MSACQTIDQAKLISSLQKQFLEIHVDLIGCLKQKICSTVSAHATPLQMRVFAETLL